MRYSKQREALIKLLLSTKSHPDAEWLYEGLKKEYPSISLGTVYRNLRQLADKGEILELSYGHTSHFDADLSPHYHFQCDLCKKIYDIPPEDITISIKTKQGFSINGFNLVLNGICCNCK